MITHLRHDNKLITREVKFLDRISQDDFREAVGVDLSGMESSLVRRRHGSAETTYISGIERCDPTVPAERCRV